MLQHLHAQLNQSFIQPAYDAMIPPPHKELAEGRGGGPAVGDDDKRKAISG